MTTTETHGTREYLFIGLLTALVAVVLGAIGLPLAVLIVAAGATAVGMSVLLERRHRGTEGDDGWYVEGEEVADEPEEDIPHFRYASPFRSAWARALVDSGSTTDTDAAAPVEAGAVRDEPSASPLAASAWLPTGPVADDETIDARVPASASEPSSWDVDPAPLVASQAGEDELSPSDRLAANEAWLEQVAQRWGEREGTTRPPVERPVEPVVDPAPAPAAAASVPEDEEEEEVYVLLPQTARAEPSAHALPTDLRPILLVGTDLVIQQANRAADVIFERPVGRHVADVLGGRPPGRPEPLTAEEHPVGRVLLGEEVRAQPMVLDLPGGRAVTIASARQVKRDFESPSIAIGLRMLSPVARTSGRVTTTSSRGADR